MHARMKTDSSVDKKKIASVEVQSIGIGLKVSQLGGLRSNGW